MKPTKKIIVFLILLLIVSATACGGVSASDSAAPASSGAQDVPNPNVKGLKIAFTRSIVNEFSVQYEKAARERFEEYKELGIVSEYTYAINNHDITEQLNQLNQLLQQDYDLIMIEPASASSMGTVIEEAKAKGIKLMFGMTNSPYEGIPCFSSDYTIFGVAEAYYLADKLGGKGNIIEMYGIPGDPNHDFFKNTIQQGLSGTNIKTLTEGFGRLNNADSQTEMATLLATYGEQIDAVWIEGCMSLGIVNAYKNAGLPLVPLGGDDSKVFIDYWYENQDTMDCVMVANSPACWAEAMVDCAIYTAAGYKPKEMLANPIDESVKNWIPITMPWIILEKSEMNPEWLSEFPDTKAMSLDDAYKSLEGKQNTDIVVTHFDDDYIAGLFGLEHSPFFK